MGVELFLDKESVEWLNRALEKDTIDYVVGELKRKIYENWENSDIDPSIWIPNKPNGHIDSMFLFKKLTIELADEYYNKKEEDRYIKKIVYAFDGVIG